MSYRGQNPVSMTMHQSKSQKFTIQQKNYHTHTQMHGVGPTLNRAIPLSVGHNPLHGKCSIFLHITFIHLAFSVEKNPVHSNYTINMSKSMYNARNWIHESRVSFFLSVFYSSLNENMNAFFHEISLYDLLSYHGYRHFVKVINSRSCDLVIFSLCSK